ncbi:hypothetical protein HanXRQr2_Chr14g0642001 [Helianthus annuus]|uniref:Retrotransposon gag domain-containing protein n=1 Tax=Helianthus annuus TaxID=4232 RepID=A0A9K3E8N5_HELAN|nr:hypothetical protein HanXRQr2_Chr14g0642001 [Helianthus annuus]KAJ0840198.1 hypothetical protein HanPSC8_Chr14g0615821 [Helianthus annuus]
MLLAVYSLIAIALLKRVRTLNDRFLYSDCLMCFCASVLLRAYTMSSSGSLHSRTVRRNQKDKRLAALVAKQIAKVIPRIVSDLHENTSKSSEESRTDSPKPVFSFKQFKACGPKEFTGKDGPTALFQWFDSIEVTLRQSGCPDDLRTLNATGVFQSRALDWWMAERNKRGNDVAYGLTCDELKNVMLEEFCPPHERQKLEDEFWHF